MRNLIVGVLILLNFAAQAEDFSFEVALKLSSPNIETYSLTPSYDYATNQSLEIPSVEIVKNMGALKQYFLKMPEFTSCGALTVNAKALNISTKQRPSELVDVASIFDSTINFIVTISTDSCTSAVAPVIPKEKKGFPVALTNYSLPATNRKETNAETKLPKDSFDKSIRNSFSDSIITAESVQTRSKSTLSASELAPICTNGNEVNKLPRRHNLLLEKTGEQVGEVIYTGFGICKN